MKEIKTILIDDNDEFLKSFSAYLSNIKNLNVVGIGYNELDAFALINENKPDLIFLDVILPETNGFMIAKKIKEAYPNLKIIIISVYDYIEYYDLAKQSGADEFICKNNLVENLSPAIQNIFKILMLIVI